MFAVIKTGGKQYIVEPGTKLKIEKLKETEGDIVFNEVLLVEKNKKLEIGNPIVQGATVIAKMIGEGKRKKVIIMKYKAKKRQRTKTGHRQLYTEVEITKIETKA